MSLESANYVADLVDTNPPGSDPKAQGDDHLRMLKAVLKATFPGADRPMPFPTTEVQSINFSVDVTDFKRTFLVTTAAAEVTAVLPVLGTGDAGWKCGFIKTNTDLNALFITPTSGTLQSGAVSGLGAARRVIPGVETTALWTGSAWILSRAVNAPIGSVLDLHATALPVGYEWPNGQTLASASTKYPEFYAVNGNSGLTINLRGRVVAGKDDMGGTSQNVLTGQTNGINGDTYGALGGEERHQLTIPELAEHTHIQDPHTHPHNASVTALRQADNSQLTQNYSTEPVAATINNATAVNQDTGSDTPHNNIQPTAILNKILVVE